MIPESMNSWNYVGVFVFKFEFSISRFSQQWDEMFDQGQELERIDDCTGMSC